MVLLVNSQAFASCLAITKYYPGKTDMQQVLEQATNLGIDSSISVDKIIGKSGQSPMIKVIYHAHEDTEFYSTNSELICQQKGQWNCEKKDMIKLRFDLKQEKNITIEKTPNISAEEYIEIALAANNQRPMSWNNPILTIVPKPDGVFKVTFGKGVCTQNLYIQRTRKNDENHFLVLWDKTIDGSGCFEGCDNDSRYVIYENGEWLE